MRILVTGLTGGFTGPYIKKELEAYDHEVIGLKSDITKKNDLIDEVASIQPEAVVHLAGISFVEFDNANAFYNINLVGTRNLLDAIYQTTKNIKNILLVSSANVYGNQLEENLSEEMALKPSNDYAVSKFAMEVMAGLWANRLPLVIVRPFNYTGVGQKDSFVIPKLVKHFQKKSPVIELGNLDVYREYNDVRMIVEIYRKLLFCAPLGETFNVCSGRGYSLREIVECCEKITGHKIEVNINPKFVRTNEVKSLVGINKKLKRYVDHWATYELESTLEWMINSD